MSANSPVDVADRAERTGDEAEPPELLKVRQAASGFTSLSLSSAAPGTAARIGEALGHEPAGGEGACPANLPPLPNSLDAPLRRRSESAPPTQCQSIHSPVIQGQVPVQHSLKRAIPHQLEQGQHPQSSVFFF